MDRGNDAELRCITWNIAAINNNPFEYYVTFKNGSGYDDFMVAVQQFIDSPGDRDVPVCQVFTPQMFAKLQEAMVAEGWQGVDKVVSLWLTDFSSRKIISGFLKDKDIGSKRLASMPDRFTNTINCADGSIVYRPTIINNYQEEMSSPQQWFDQWFDFFFNKEISVKNKKGEAETKKVCQLLQPIKRAKYPAVTEEEEAISIPLQLLAQAIFDAILLHVVNVSASEGRDSPINWHQLKLKLCDALVTNKQANVIKVLEQNDNYINADVIFLQEGAGAFIEKFNGSSSLNTRFQLLTPKNVDYVRDQNSLILIAKDRLPAGAASDSFDELDLASLMDADVPIADGDVCALIAPLLLSGSPVRTALVSFHGDTAGLASTPVVNAVRKAAAAASLPVVLGLDANTQAAPDPRGANKHVDDFLNDLQEGDQPLSHCWGEADKSEWTTTCNARSYLQPQLNKAVPYNARETSQLSDINPKDFLLFSGSTFELATPACRDNTGEGKFVAGMSMPTLSFPSDHAVMYATIKMHKAP
jgi:hypothetical protein